MPIENVLVAIDSLSLDDLCMAFRAYLGRYVGDAEYGAIVIHRAAVAVDTVIPVIPPEGPLPKLSGPHARPV